MSFRNSWVNSYTKFVTLDIKVCFTLGNLDPYQNIVKYQNIMTRIVLKTRMQYSKIVP